MSVTNGATGAAQAAKAPDLRVGALRRFAFAISFLTLLGHTWLGFEPSYAAPFLALATGYSVETIIELIDARLAGRATVFSQGLVPTIDFFLPAHIGSLACAMLLYPNASLPPLAFAAATAVGTKYIFRAPIGKGWRHFLNPSNTGIGMTLLLFPWVGIAPPYHFTENLDSFGDVALPCFVVLSGSFLNVRFTKKIPLILGWVGGFLAQALLRAALFEFRLLPMIGVMFGMAFLLFTFYMISDPGTTPSKPRNQVIFGASVAALYGVLNALDIVYGMFIALMTVCTCRGIYLNWIGWRERVAARAPAVAPVEVSAAAVSERSSV